MNVGRLGDHVKILSGFAFKSGKFSDSEGMPLIRIRDVKRGFTETFYSGEYDSTYVVENGDLLIGMDGEFNCEKWQGGKALLNQRVCKIIADNKILDQSYLYFFLPQELKKIEDSTPAVTVKHLSAKKINEIQIPLPPLPEQRRIAAILDKADAIRRKRQQAIRLTEEFLRSVFLDMFGDPVLNPKGWEVVSLGEIGLVQGGLQVTPKRAGNPIEVPYLRVANIYRDRLDLNEIKKIQITKAELERIRLQRGDMLMVEGHGNPSEIGRSAIWDGSIDDCVHQNHLIRVRMDKKYAYPEYVSTYLNSPGGRRQLFRHGKTTSGLNTISTSNVKSTSIVLPPLKVQGQFLEVAKSVKVNGRKMDLSLEEQNYLFNSLVQCAFRGNL